MNRRLLRVKWERMWVDRILGHNTNNKSMKTFKKNIFFKNPGVVQLNAVYEFLRSLTRDTTVLLSVLRFIILLKTKRMCVI